MILAALFWQPSTEVLYRDIAGAKQLCSTFRFKLSVAPGYAGKAGFIEFDAAGRVTVSPGYVWDGASGPTIDTLDSVCAALGHDVMYELMSLGFLPVFVYKNVADIWFYERLQADGMPQLRAWYWYKAVYVFGVPGLSDDQIVKRAPVPFDIRRPQWSPVPGYHLAM
ncbi:MAG: hypothetical protein ACR652_18535 [Methylocystis sp.]|uniref:hypothetical protein n=1 Tax=Methylocystis sp. TaxID=1911079 RepID=UPI003DA6BC64